MILKELFKKSVIILEGGNLEIDNPDFDPTQPESPNNPKVIQAQEIQLAPTKISDEVQDRTHMVGVLKNLFIDINKTFTAIYKTQLFNPAILDKEIKDFMAGSSQHFFDLLRPNPNFNPKHPESEQNPKMIGISDEEFKKYKPTVGDIDIQCNQELQDKILEFLTNNVKRPVGNAILLGPPSAGNEQYNTLWQLSDPPIKVQIDFEYGRYSPITQKPDEWTKFSHSSAWEDIQQGIKGVFHKYIYRALAKAVPTEKYIAKLDGRGKARAIAISGPVTDANFSFSVASKGGGGIRAKYKPYIDPATGQEKVIDGIPVLEPLETKDSEYVQDLGKQFSLFFGRAPTGDDRKLQDSFVGTMELMNKYLDDNAKRTTVSDFFNIVFEPGGQMITKGDPKRDYAVKFAAIDKMLEVLGLQDMSQTAETMAQEYEKDYLDLENFKRSYKPTPDQAGKKLQYGKLRKDAIATGKWNPLAENFVKRKSLNEAEVKAQLRKGMPHLHDLKPADLLDLLDEIHDGNGSFKLQNIPLNLKIDGFGGRFGKNSDGKPFMGTSRTEPRYEPGFVAYHQKKGTTDPEILGRAELFDQLFEEMMNAVKLVDSKLGPGFLVNKQVTCEVLYLPFATETDEGKLKFVGIHYDKLPAGVKLALVPFHITDATTGDTLPNGNQIVKELTSAGRMGSVMFIDNSLTQNEALDVTALVPPVENIEQLKAMLASNKLEARRQVKAALEPVAIALEKAIINDPNIIGKDLLGQDYEGIVINSRLGPIKVTSQEQRDVITAKNAAKASARTERPRENNNKTAVVAIGSFIGHKGHEDLFKYTIDKAKELGGDPYLFIGNAEGKDDPIPPSVKVQTWHKLYPQYAQNISTVNHEGGTLIQKIKHELINPLPGKPPRYDNIVIMVGEDRAGLTMPQALMKAVNKFQGYEHVKVSLEVTPREAGVSGTALRNSLKNGPPEKALAVWSNAFDVNKLGVDWIEHLMDITRKGMGIQEPQQPVQQQQPVPVAEQRLFNALIRPETTEIRLDEFDLFKKGLPMKVPAKRAAATSAEMRKFFQAQSNKEKPGLKPQTIDRDNPQKVYVKYAEEEIEDNDAMSHMAKDLTGKGAPIAKAAAQRDKKREQQSTQSYGRAEGPKWGVAEEEIKNNHWYDAGVKDATRGARPNPRTYLPTLKDKQAKHPEEVYFYMNGYKGVKPGVAEGLLNELTGYGSDKKYDYSGTHKRYEVYVSKQKFNNLYFIAVAENPRTLEAKFKAKGNNPQEAVNNLKLEIDKEIDVATKVSGQAILDFNVEFAKDILEMSTDVFYAKIIVGPRLVIAGPEMMEYPDIMRDEGFKPSAIRTYKGGEGTTKLPGVQLSSKAAAAANLIANGRYVLGNETVDKDGNRVFELNFDSVVQAKNDRMRLRAPALTVGTNRLQGVAEGEGGLGQVAGIGINGKQFNFSIKDLIAKAQNYPIKKLNPQLFVKQLADRHEDPKQTAARAQSADLQYPIIVVQDGNTLMIADGTHRAQKAIMNKLPAINAHVIPVEDMAEFVKQGVAEAAAPVTHRIGLTVTDPNHPMVSKRGETYQKSVRVTGPDREAAINQAIAHHRRKGYKVHDHHYLGTVDQGVAEAPKSAAVRLGRAIQRVQGKTAASQARSVIPSSIPKPEPKPQEKQVTKELKTGPAAHFTPKDAHVKRGQFVGGESKKKGADGKACWDRYRYNGTENGKDKCVKVSEDVENIMATLINKIVVNEAIQNNKR